MQPHKESPILPLLESYIRESRTSATPTIIAELRTVVQRVLQDVISVERASVIFTSKIGTDTPLRRISDILTISCIPIAQPRPTVSRVPTRKNTRTWTEYEDKRLICGLHRYGFDNLQQVAQFVGNGRTRSQCSQRWFRVLDPRISREAWTADEEERLTNLIQLHGKRAWGKIANALGSRTDSQCRYHYYHMIEQKDSGEKDSGAPVNESGSAPLATSNSVPASPMTHPPLTAPPKHPRLPSINELLMAVDSQGWKVGCPGPEPDQDLMNRARRKE
jgi:hypothetical protein